MAEAGKLSDPRCREAIGMLRSKELPGGWIPAGAVQRQDQRSDRDPRELRGLGAVRKEAYEPPGHRRGSVVPEVRSSGLRWLHGHADVDEEPAVGPARLRVHFETGPVVRQVAALRKPLAVDPIPGLLEFVLGELETR